MPKYLNEGPGVRLVEDIHGEFKAVRVGDSIETYKIMEGMTLLEDAPYFNPVPAGGVHAVSSTGADDDQLILLSVETDEIEIYNESDAEITVFLRALANTSGLKVFANSIRTISGFKGKADQLVMQFSQAGACTVTEIKG